RLTEVEANGIPHVPAVLDVDRLIQSKALAVGLEHSLAVLDPSAGVGHARRDGADGVTWRQARDDEVERSGDKDDQENHAEPPHEVAEVKPAHEKAPPGVKRGPFRPPLKSPI